MCNVEKRKNSEKSKIMTHLSCLIMVIIYHWASSTEGLANNQLSCKDCVDAEHFPDTCLVFGADDKLEAEMFGLIFAAEVAMRIGSSHTAAFCGKCRPVSLSLYDSPVGQTGLFGTRL